MRSKKDNHLRVVVVSTWSVFVSVYFWPLYNFFIQRLPLYYDDKVLVSTSFFIFFGKKYYGLDSEIIRSRLGKNVYGLAIEPIRRERRDRLFVRLWE